METRYYIHKRIYENFFNLSIVRGEEKKVVFIIKEQEAILGNETWDIRVPRDSRYLCNTLKDALKILNPMLIEQVSEVREKLAEVENFLGAK